jgi:hypothetical protein
MNEQAEPKPRGGTSELVLYSMVVLIVTLLSVYVPA